MAENSCFFVPNIVAYFRVMLVLTSSYYMPNNYVKASVLYTVCSLLDEVDGYLARLLDQESKLGALLDLMIDRMLLLCLCIALCHIYPKYTLFFQAYIAIDIFSHWFHHHSSLMKGFSSHKVIEQSGNPVMKLYYNNSHVLFTLNKANELFFLTLYICYFTRENKGFGVMVWKLILYISAPLSFIKTGVSIVQFYAAMQSIAAIDAASRKKILEP